MRQKIFFEKLLDKLKTVEGINDITGNDRIGHTLALKFAGKSPLATIRYYADFQRKVVQAISDAMDRLSKVQDINKGIDMNKVPYEDKNLIETVVSSGPGAFVSHREKMVRFGAFIDDFIAGKNQVYRIAEEFGTHLSKSNIDMSMSFIPFEIHKQYFIELPKMFECRGDYFRSVLVTMDNVNNDSNIVFMDTKGISFFFPVYDRKGEYTGKDHNLVIPYNVDMSIEESVSIVDNVKMDEQDSVGDGTLELVSYIAKCMLYIESGEPDLERERAKDCKARNKAKIRLFKKNHCPFDITNVGYIWQKKILYSMESTGVRFHFRFQPYGPGRTKLKYIPIQPYVKYYKNVRGKKEVTEECKTRI